MNTGKIEIMSVNIWKNNCIVSNDILERRKSKPKRLGLVRWEKDDFDADRKKLLQLLERHRRKNNHTDITN